MREEKIHEARIEKVREILSKKRLDAAVLFSGESHNDLSSKSTYYLTNFFDSWSHAVLITKSDAVLFTGEPERAEKEGMIKNIKYSKKEKINDFLKANRIKRIGFDAALSFVRGTELKEKLKTGKLADISREMLEMRAIKDAEELSKIKSACRITGETLDVVKNSVNSGDEGALIRKIKTEFINRNAETAFKPVVAGDENSANIHYFACNGRFKKIVMADIGARIDFYNSDFTRTFMLEENAEMIRAHQTLEDLVAELSDFIKPDIKCFDAFNYAKKFLEKEGYKKENFANFQSLGHGVGLDVHEYPVLTGNPLFKKMTFKKGMVFTIEPALYFTGKFGIRIENTVLLEENGVKSLG